MHLIEKIAQDSTAQQQSKSNLLIQFRNCRLVRQDKLIREDLWVRNDKIQNPEKIFFDERVRADIQIDCGDLIIAPGFIDVQINGGFGKDFTYDIDNIEENLALVSERLLQYGVTAYCPTLVSSNASTYASLLPKIKRTYPPVDHKVQPKAAYILGVHLEGPFISREKLGAHESKNLNTFDKGVKSLEEVYGPVSLLEKNVSIVTLAPELDPNFEVTRFLTAKKIIVSLGHSSANLSQGERAVENGARLITHLFNAMLPFHHRDPHLFGLLSNRNLVKQENIYYGIIADGIHTHPSALNIAYKAHPNGLALVTDAVSAMGLDDGCVHHIGDKEVEIVVDAEQGIKSAFVQGTHTLCGSVITMDDCVRNLMKATGCSIVEALKCASEHPAKMLHMYPAKGSLEYGADADFLLVDEQVNITATFINGDLVWSRANWSPEIKAAQSRPK